MTNRAKQLESLASQMPGANQQIAQGLQQARQMQMQEQIKGMQAPVGPMAAQQMGAQQAQQAGAINVQAAQQLQNQQVQAGQMGLQQQARTQRKEAFSDQIQLSQKQQEYANALNQLGNETRNELLDNQLRFQKDEAGRALMNDRQMLDYALTQAKSEEEFLQWSQGIQQVHERKIQSMEHASRILEEVLRKGHLKNKQQLDQAQRKEILQKKIAMDKQIARERAQKNSRNSMIKGALTVIGAGIAVYATAGLAAPVVAAGVSGGAATGGGFGDIFTSQMD